MHYANVATTSWSAATLRGAAAIVTVSAVALNAAHAAPPTLTRLIFLAGNAGERSRRTTPPSGHADNPAGKVRLAWMVAAESILRSASSLGVGRLRSWTQSPQGRMEVKSASPRTKNSAQCCSAQCSVQTALGLPGGQPERDSAVGAGHVLRAEAFALGQPGARRGLGEPELAVDRVLAQQQPLEHQRRRHPRRRCKGHVGRAGRQQCSAAIGCEGRNPARKDVCKRPGHLRSRIDDSGATNVPRVYACAVTPTHSVFRPVPNGVSLRPGVG